jgi:hypothetical protein
MEALEINERLGKFDKTIEKGKNLGLSNEKVKSSRRMPLNVFLRVFNKYSSDSKICEYKIDTSHLKKMEEATNLPFLLIFESKSEIYFYLNMKKFVSDILGRFINSLKHLKDPMNKVIEIEQEKKEKVEAVLKNLKDEYLYKQPINESEVSGVINNLLKSLEGSDENKVKNQGSELKGALIPPKLTELKSEIDEIKDIWIFCREKYFDYRWGWEWIYWKDNFKKEEFFWGDKFHIVRIPRDCDFKDSKFQINTFTILLDNPCKPARRLHKISHKYLNALLKDIVTTCEENIVCTYKELSKLKISNCVHLGGNRETFEDEQYLETILDILSRTKPKFLFLNMFANKSSSTQCNLSKKIYKNLDPHTTWVGVDCSLNVPDEFALVFEECFYEVLKNSLQNNNKEVKITEIIAKTREKIEEIKNQEDLGCSSFWKLAYVVNGNPYNKLIFA